MHITLSNLIKSKMNENPNIKEKGWEAGQKQISCWPQSKVDNETRLPNNLKSPNEIWQTLKSKQCQWRKIEKRGSGTVSVLCWSWQAKWVPTAKHFDPDKKAIRTSNRTEIDGIFWRETRRWYNMATRKARLMDHTHTSNRHDNSMNK